MNEKQSQNLLLKVDPLSAILIRNNELIAQGEELKTSAKLRVFVSNILSLRLKRRYFVLSISPPLEQRNKFNFFVVYFG